MISHNIRNLRKQCNLTQTELGQKIGYRHSTIAGYESGRTVPTADIMEKLAKAFDVPVASLYEENPQTEKTVHEVSSSLVEQQMSMLQQQQEMLKAQHKTIDTLVEIIGRK